METSVENMIFMFLKRKSLKLNTENDTVKAKETYSFAALTKWAEREEESISTLCTFYIFLLFNKEL